MVVSGLASVIFWDALNANESSSATVRNLALVISVVIALPLAIWRSMVAARQAETAYRGLLNERYQKGSEMIGSNVLSVRLGGIYALRRLAEEHPEEYHVQIMRLFCAFVRHPVDKYDLQSEEALAVTERGESDEENQYGVESHRPDIYAIMEAIFQTDKRRIELEIRSKFRLDFRGASLNRLVWDDFTTINLRGADLSHTDMSGISFAFHEFVYDRKIEFSGVSLYRTNLSGTNLCGVKGLTQRVLDLAFSHPERPPYLRGLIDARTNEELLWKPIRNNN